MMQRTIVLAIHQFLPEFGAGTEILTLSLARVLRERGYLIRILSGVPSSGSMSLCFSDDEYDGFPVHRCHVPRYGKASDRNPIEDDVYNDDLHAHFLEWLVEIKPVHVHVMHFSRLSGGLISAMATLSIPFTFTPTDFWSVCILGQLTLDNGRPCQGPAIDGGNCIKHLAARSVTTGAWHPVHWMPGRVFGFFARIASSLPVKNVPHIQHALSLSTRHARLVKQLNSARRIFPPTRQTFEVLAAAGIHPDLLAYQPYGLNLEHIKRHPRPALKSSGLHVGFIGTLSPHKGAHVLLEAVKSVSPDVHLSIWGKETDFPEYVSTLKAMAGTQPTIAFRGTFDNDTFSDVLATLDCVVVPSLWRENAPLVMLSSLAAGCPVLASDYPGLAEHVKNGENGFLFIPGDAASLASLIQRLRDDKELLARLSNGSTPPPSIHEYVDFLISSIFK